MARKREKTETVGTGFGIVAVVEAAGTVGEFCETPAAEARFVSGCRFRDTP